MRDASTVRWLLLALAAIGAAACGGGNDQVRKAQSPGKCVAAAGGYKLCGQPTGQRTSPPASTIMRGEKVIATAIERVGHWRKLFVSPDGATLLAEWSGACEIPTAYLISVDGGKPRAVTDYSKGSAISFALGWTGSRARVRMPVGQWPKLTAGIYLVDPATMRKSLVRRLPKEHSC